MVIKTCYYGHHSLTLNYSSTVLYIQQIALLIFVLLFVAIVQENVLDLV